MHEACSGQPCDDNSQNKPSLSVVHWKYHKFLDEDILNLPRLPDLWNGLMVRKDIFKLALPEMNVVGKSPGNIFLFAEEMVEMVPELHS